jgi:N-acetylneuraminate synthase/N,N'-diacetyllegionaminate synthase
VTATWENLDFERPLLIAEIGGNHEGSIERAFDLSRLAVEAGADAVKFQTYWADSLVNAKLSPDRHAHFRRFELTREQWRELAGHVQSLGAEFMTSLWDPDAIEEIAPLVPAWKVGSGDLTNVQLLARLLATGKPLIISTAMADLAEVDAAIAFVGERAPGAIEAGKIALLQCTAMYDTPKAEDVDLAVMGAYRERYPGVIVGYSDHELGLRAAVTAAAIGAQILEFHFTDDKTREFRDHKLSLDTDELRELRAYADQIPVLRGTATKQVKEQERENRKTFRRAVFPTRDLPSGHLLVEEDLVVLRPNEGIDAAHYFELLGSRLTRDVEALDPLRPDDVAPE